MPPAQPALHRAIVAIDIERFGDPRRTNPDQVRARDGLYRAMRRAFSGSEISWTNSHHEDRGDGVLVLIPPEVPKARLSGDLPRELAAAVTRHNSDSDPHARIRLRMALHAGEVHRDEYGVAGSCITIAFRLLEAPNVKDALATSTGPLIVVASEWFFDEVIRHDTHSRSDEYRSIEVSVKETSTTALIRLLDQPDIPAAEEMHLPGRPVVWDAPPVWNVPRRNPDFIGRTDLLDRLTDMLDVPGSALSPRACALHGMGGAGKSQIAREFAHRSSDRLRGVWWVDASHPFSMVRDLTELADRFELPQDDDTLYRVRQLWFELSERGRWLLIYDNAENEKDLKPWWPTADVGFVLVTSRTATWRFADAVQVFPFSRDESITYLYRIAGQDELRESAASRRSEADQVANELGDLPLALAQAAAYVTRNRTGWRHYADMLRRAPARLMHLNRPDDYLGTAATTWSLSMTRVEEERPESADLLRLCAFLDSDHIPRNLISPGATGLPPALRLMAEDQVTYDLTVGALAEYALIDATPEALAVHPLVQTMIRESLPERERHTWIAAAATQLSLSFPAQPRLPESWRECTSLLPHVAAVSRHARASGAAPVEVSGICQRAAAYLEVRAQFAPALELLDHALVLREDAYGRQSGEFAETLTSRGETECYLGHHRTAVETARAVLAIRDQLGDRDSSGMLLTLRLLGRALTEAGHPTEAVAVLERAVGIGDHVLGASHPRMAELVARLAYAYWRSGDLQRAREAYERADEIWRTVGSVPDRERTAAYRWQAMVLCDLREHAAARAVIDEAIGMAQELYGPDHVETMRAEETLGVILAASGDPLEGERLQSRAAQFLREFYPVPVVVAGTLTALARTLLLADRAEDALVAAEDAIDLYVNRHGTVDHVYNAGALTALGMAQRRLGRFGDATRSLARAREIYEQAGGPAHLLNEVLAELARCS